MPRRESKRIRTEVDGRHALQDYTGCVAKEIYPIQTSSFETLLKIVGMGVVADNDAIGGESYQRDIDQLEARKPIDDDHVVVLLFFSSQNFVDFGYAFGCTALAHMVHVNVGGRLLLDGLVPLLIAF